MAEKDCTFCSQTLPQAQLSKLECAHEACAECLRKLFSTYPARCCIDIPLTEERIKVLGPMSINKYISKNQEKSAEMKTYCSKPDCGTFIHSSRFLGKKAICPSCYHMTCIECRETAHGDDPCSPDPDIAALYDLAETEGWKICFSCGALVESVEGCSVIEYVT